MKMEKISDTQIKFILTKSDLISRNLNLSDLTQQNEKTSQLFKEMLDKAVKNFNLKPEANPFMIEAMPMNDGIMILISKVDSDKSLNSGFDFLPETLKTGRFRQGSFLELREEAAPHINRKDAKYSVFVFNSMDEASSASKRIKSGFEGESSLLKLKDSFYLLLKRRKAENELKTDYLEAALSEYGRKDISNSVSSAYIREHGEVIIVDRAINILSDIF